MWKKLLAGLAALLLILVAAIAARSSTYRVERSVRIAAPPGAVYVRVADFRRWAEWSPWAHADPGMRQSFEGAPSGTGAEYAWSGNAAVGEGRMSIVEAVPDRLVRIRMDLLHPLKSTSLTELRLEPEGAGVRVVWALDGRTGFAGKAVSLLVDMPAMLGRDFEKGLASLKGVAEAEAAGPAAPR